MTPIAPPDHVLAAFGLTAHPPIALADSWHSGWRVGEVVLSLVPDYTRAAWSAKVRENLYVDGLRIARPYRAADGRYVVSGWRADSYIAGSPEPRHDEVLSVADRLHTALAGVGMARFLVQPPAPPHSDVDVFVAADRAAWEDPPLRSAHAAGMAEHTTVDGHTSVEALKMLAKLRKPVEMQSQVVHGDLFGTVLFAGAAAPGITDIVPYWRPAEWGVGGGRGGCAGLGRCRRRSGQSLGRSRRVATDVVACHHVPSGGPCPAPPVLLWRAARVAARRRPGGVARLERDTAAGHLSRRLG